MPEKGFFAERLKELREQAGMSQPTLAERCGIGVSTLRQFEYGMREPTYGTLVKLAEGLGVSLAAFEASHAAGQRKTPKAPPSTPPAGDPEAEAEARHHADGGRRSKTARAGGGSRKGRQSKGR